MQMRELITKTVKFNQTFDKAVSRILSPVVAMVTNESTAKQILHLQFQHIGA